MFILSPDYPNQSISRLYMLEIMHHGEDLEVAQEFLVRRRLSRTSSSATLNGRPDATGDQLPVEGPRNPRSEADRGWLQRLVRLVLHRNITRMVMLDSDFYAICETLRRET